MILIQNMVNIGQPCTNNYQNVPNMVNKQTNYDKTTMETNVDTSLRNYNGHTLTERTYFPKAIQLSLRLVD